MIVRCETCQTEFSLDDAHVGRDGVTVRCSVCAHVFHVVAPSAQDIGERPWQIRTRDGLLFSANDLGVLQRWIGEGRLHPEDEVSRTGNRWVRIGQMPELSSHFARFAEAPSVLQVVDDQRGTQKYTASSKGQSSSVFFAPPGQSAAYGERTMASGGLESSSPMPGPVSAPLGSAPQVAYPPGSGLGSSRGSSPSAPVHHPPVQYGQVTMSSPRQITARMNPHLEEMQSSSESASNEETSWALSSKPSSENSSTANNHRDQEFNDSLANLHYPPQSRSPTQSASGLRASYWGILSLAAVAILVAVAVRFISHSREQANKHAQTDSSHEQDKISPQSITPQLQAVTRALNSMSLGEMREAETDVQQLLDGDRLADSSLRLSLKLALADLLSSRSLLFSMVGSLEPPRRDEYKALAESDLERASRLFDAVEIAGASSEQLLPIRVRIQLAQGASGSTIGEGLPDRGAKELRALVSAAPVWRSSDAAVEPRTELLLEDIQAIKGPSGLVRCVHALLLARSKDGEGLARVMAQLAELAVDNPLIASLQKSGAMPSDGSKRAGTAKASNNTGAKSGALFDPAQIAAAIDQARQKNLGKELAPDTKESPSKANPPSSDSKAENGQQEAKKTAPVEERFDSLLDRGCTLVEKGKAASGVKVLLRALEKRSRDIETLLCLGDGYAKMRQPNRSLQYFERVLGRSPRHRLALKGAASAAASRNDKAKALRYYEKLLLIEPRNNLAQTYISVHGSKAPPKQPSRQRSGTGTSLGPGAPSGGAPTDSSKASPQRSPTPQHDGLPAPN